MVLRIENLFFSFSESKNPVLKNINLDIGRGEFIALMGPNGSGKTTLALCMCGIIPHFFHGKYKGKVLVNKKNILHHAIHDITRDVGVLLQDYESQLFLPTIEEEIRFQMENFGLSADEKIAELFSDETFSYLLKKKLFSLSEGEKQKAILTSILCVNPDILILDEPTSQLDRREKEQLAKTLEKLNKEGKTIILITHDTCFAKHCSRFVVMRHGEIVEDTSDMTFLSKSSIGALGIEPEKYQWNTIKTCKSAEEKTKISIKNLNYKTQTPVLENINASIKNNEFILLLGGNGSGKTTLVKHVIKLLDIQAGEIKMNGTALEKYSQQDIVKQAGFIFQNPDHQIFKNSVEEELQLTLDLVKKENSGKKIDEMLSFFDLEKYRNKSPQALSAGEKHRVTLASVLVSEPEIVILDEPLTYLDFDGKMQLIEYLADLKKRGKTIIVISHRPGYYKSLVDRTFVIKNRRLTEQ
ncbi:MAG: ABC transporter ATP-binding protein [Candidatus Aenigmarchaeota archaeon]|nr:ABC transporter ATP-binding protein [Candidatus Aenigmarchaeota archaeon]